MLLSKNCVFCGWTAWLYVVTKQTLQYKNSVVPPLLPEYILINFHSSLASGRLPLMEDLWEFFLLKWTHTVWPYSSRRLHFLWDSPFSSPPFPTDPLTLLSLSLSLLHAFSLFASSSSFSPPSQASPSHLVFALPSTPILGTMKLFWLTVWPVE